MALRESLYCSVCDSWSCSGKKAFLHFIFFHRDGDTLEGQRGGKNLRAGQGLGWGGGLFKHALPSSNPAFLFFLIWRFEQLACTCDRERDRERKGPLSRVEWERRGANWRIQTFFLLDLERAAKAAIFSLSLSRILRSSLAFPPEPSMQHTIVDQCPPRSRGTLLLSPFSCFFCPCSTVCKRALSAP